MSGPVKSLTMLLFLPSLATLLAGIVTGIAVELMYPDYDVAFGISLSAIVSAPLLFMSAVMGIAPLLSVMLHAWSFVLTPQKYRREPFFAYMEHRTGVFSLIRRPTTVTVLVLLLVALMALPFFA